MRAQVLSLILLAACRGAAGTAPAVPHSAGVAPQHVAAPASEPAPSAGGIELLGGAVSRCFSPAPPDGIYDLAHTCDAPECSEPGRLRIAVVGGCVGLAREDPPDEAHHAEIEVIQRTAASALGSSERSLMVDWPTFVGGCNRGTAAAFELSREGVRVRVGAYRCAPSANGANVAAALRRIASVGDDVAILLEDSRREVVAAALERAADVGAVPCDAWADLLTAKRRAADPQLADRAMTLAADVCLAPAVEGMIADPTFGTHAASVLARLLAPEDRAALLLRTITAGRTEDDVTRTLARALDGPNAHDASTRLVAILAATERVSAVRQGLLALEVLDHAGFATSFWRIYRDAECSTRELLAADAHAFDVVIASDDAMVVEVAASALVDPGCGVAARRMGQWFGARFAHRRQSSETAFATVRRAAVRSRGARNGVRDGLACGGRSCAEPGRCHFGDVEHASVERDRLLALVALPMCPQA